AIVGVTNDVVNGAISGTNASLVGSSWSPQGQTASVNSQVSLTMHVHLEVFPGVTIFDSDVSVLVTLTTNFTMESGVFVTSPPPNRVVERVMRTDVSYDFKAQGGLEADVINDIRSLLGIGGQFVQLPPGYTQIGDREFYQDT